VNHVCLSLPEVDLEVSEVAATEPEPGDAVRLLESGLCA
jgi:hypothetical protein